jgi:lysozyme family protein
MKENWKQAFEQMLASEGGFSDDDRDPGNTLPDGRPGSTMLGVTQYNWEQHIVHQVTHDQMRKLTPADVEPLYKKKYWDAVRADELPSGIDYRVFDMGVNGIVTDRPDLLREEMKRRGLALPAMTPVLP